MVHSIKTWSIFYVNTYEQCLNYAALVPLESIELRADKYLGKRLAIEGIY